MRKEQHHLRRGTVKRYVEAAGMIAVLDVPVIYSPDAPDEPLLEAKTIKLLDEAQRRADAGDRRWLLKHGRLYEAQPA